MKRAQATIVILLATCFPGSPQGAQGAISLGGYYKNFFTVFMPPPSRGTPPADQYPRGAVSNRLRLKTTRDVGHSLLFHAAYSLSPRVQDPSLFLNPAAVTAFEGVGQGYRFADLNALLYGPEGNVAVFHELDRAYLKIAVEKADLYAGRQAIAWGSARVINPTDIILPFSFNALDTEERPGADAVRVRFPTGELSEIDAGCVAGRNFLIRESAFFVRNSAYIREIDASAVVMWFKENLLAGIDLARSLGGAGIWLEAASVIPDVFEGRNGNGGGNYLRLSTGADYSFTGRTYGFIEYHYNGAGADEPERYPEIVRGTAYTEGSVYLLGKQYLIPGLTYQVSPLIVLSAQFFVNIADGSFFGAPLIEYNLFENVYVSIGALAGAGEAPELVAAGEAAPAATVFHSEFGAYPAVYFTSFRIYF